MTGRQVGGLLPDRMRFGTGSEGASGEKLRRRTVAQWNGGQINHCLLCSKGTQPLSEGHNSWTCPTGCHPQTTHIQACQRWRRSISFVYNSRAKRKAVCDSPGCWRERKLIKLILRREPTPLSLLHKNFLALRLHRSNCSNLDPQASGCSSI